MCYDTDSDAWLADDFEGIIRMMSYLTVIGPILVLIMVSYIVNIKYMGSVRNFKCDEKMKLIAN